MAKLYRTAHPPGSSASDGASASQTDEGGEGFFESFGCGDGDCNSAYRGVSVVGGKERGDEEKQISMVLHRRKEALRRGVVGVGGKRGRKDGEGHADGPVPWHVGYI